MYRYTIHIQTDRDVWGDSETTRLLHFRYCFPFFSKWSTWCIMFVCAEVEEGAQKYAICYMYFSTECVMWCSVCVEKLGSLSS